MMRRRLAIIEDMIKHMSIELNKFVPDYQKIWKSNPTFGEDMKRRKSKDYKYGV
jgi:hypothetical protein